MEPATAELIKTVSTDLIKIAGPALIAAYVAYKTAKAQFEIKLKELEKTHEFGARQMMFTFHREKLANLRRGNQKLYASLGDFLGKGIASTMLGSEEDRREYLNTYAHMIDFYSRLLPKQIDETLVLMEKEGLKETGDFKELRSDKEKVSVIRFDGTLDSYKEIMLLFLEVTQHLTEYEEEASARDLEKVLKKYID